MSGYIILFLLFVIGVLFFLAWRWKNQNTKLKADYTRLAKGARELQVRMIRLQKAMDKTGKVEEEEKREKNEVDTVDVSDLIDRANSLFRDLPYDGV